MKISDIMTPYVATCNINDTLARAAQLMWDHDCGAIPVLDSRGCTVGIVTDRDICMAAYTQGKALRDIPVSTAASHRVVSARPDDSVEQVAEMMRAHQIRRVPVLDGQGEPVGMFALGDLARRGTKQTGYGDLSADTIAQTLTAVSTPRQEPELRKGPVYHVRSTNGGWAVFDTGGHRLTELQRTQGDGVVHAKERARRDGNAQIIVHHEDGSIASEFIYQTEERSSLAFDDSVRSLAASRPAQVQKAKAPGHP